ncbi:MAG: DNA polymerase domain-containing protein [Janthinobacterium lividum]
MAYYLTKVWCTNENIYGEVIDRKSLKHESLLLVNYQYNFSLIINNNNKIAMIRWLTYIVGMDDGAVTEVRIMDNFFIKAYNLTLLELIFQHSAMNVDSHWKGFLVNIRCKSEAACNKLMRLFHLNAAMKKEKVLIQESFNLNYTLAFDNFFEESAANINSTRSMGKFKYYTTTVKTINLEKYFKPMGYYDYMNGFLKLANVTETIPFIQKYLPIVTFDIETIADNLTVVPTGVVMSEKISSLVLLVEYKGIYIVYGFYLSHKKFQSEDEDFRKNFIAKYSSDYFKYADKPPKIIFRINTYYDEGKLIRDFMEYYSDGLIFTSIGLTKQYPHLIQGHNLIDYDFPFIVNRMMLLHMPDLFKSFVKIESIGRRENKCTPKYRFHRNGIILDLMKIIKQNQPGAKLALKHVCKMYLPEDEGKNDLNSVDIRKYYILLNSLSDDNIDELRKFYKVVNHARPLPFNAERQMIKFNELPFENVYFDSKKFPKIKKNMLKTPCLEHIMIYNIMDCISVAEVFKQGNFYNLLIIFISLFYADIETSCMSGNSIRLRTCLEAYSLRYNHFLGRRKQAKHIIAVPNISKFCLGNFEEVSVIETFQYKDGKKKYDGALNYAKSGVYMETAGMDVVSYYPNLLRLLKMSYNRLSVITVGEFKKIPNYVTWFEKFIHTGIITLISTKNPTNEYGEETYDHISLAYRGPEIGEVIVSSLILESMLDETVMFIYLQKAKSDSTAEIVNEILNERFRFKSLLKENKKALALIEKQSFEEKLDDATMKSKKADISRLIQKCDANQLALKIIANSVYGVEGTNQFCFSHIPISALIALLGRKYLSLIARLIQYFTYDELLIEMESKPKNEQTPVCNQCGSVITRAWLEDQKEYLDMVFPCKFTNNLHYYPLIEESSIKMDSDIIIYVDTDGIQYRALVDPAKITERVNEYIKIHLESDTIVMEDEGKSAMATILMCKTYNLSNSIPRSVDNLIKTKHNGYEKNAITPIKNIYNYLVQLIYYSQKEDLIVYPIHLLLDIYSYLRSLNPCQMSIKIQLNKHKGTESALARYINANTISYQGHIETMMLLDANDPLKDKYMSKMQWIELLEAGAYENLELNLQKYIRNHFKIFFRMINFMKITPRSRKFFDNNHQQLLSAIKHLSDIIYKMYVSEFMGISLESPTKIGKNFKHTLQNVFNELYNDEKVSLSNMPGDVCEIENYINDENEILKERHLQLFVHYNIKLYKFPFRIVNK